MTPRQCEIAAESYSASLLSQSGYDVLVQYGANQPHYDLVVEKEHVFVPVSVKGSQDGGWMLAVRYREKGGSYHDAIDRWLAAQRKDIVYLFVQFIHVPIGGLPRAYVATPDEIAKQLKSQCDGRGYGSLQEDIRKHKPGSKYSHKLPEAWLYSAARFEHCYKKAMQAGTP